MDAPWFRFYEPEVPRTIDDTGLTVPELLDRAAWSYPDHVALRFFVDPKLPATTLTFRALQDEMQRFAAALSGLGVRKGDRVAIMLPNCPQFVVAFHAVLRLGAIVVNTNPLYVAREMSEQFKDAGCETVILLDAFYPRLKEVQAQTAVKRVIVVDIAERLPWVFRTLVHRKQKKEGERVEVRAGGDVFSFRRLLGQNRPQTSKPAAEPEDVALFQYTGGTTGVPKAAMLTHRNLVANTLQLGAWFANARPGSEVVLGAIPFFHVYGMTTCMLLGIWLGAEVVLLPRPRPVENVLELIEK